MPTKNPRIQVTFESRDLYETVIRDARNNTRSESGQVIFVLKEYYRVLQRQSELFTRPQLREGQRDEAQVFEMPSPHQVEPPSRVRKTLGQDKS